MTFVESCSIQKKKERFEAKRSFRRNLGHYKRREASRSPEGDDLSSSIFRDASEAVLQGWLPRTFSGKSGF